MQIQGQMSQALNMYQQNTKVNKENKQEIANNDSIEEVINNSAAKVALSMNAQYILFEMNAADMTKGNIFGQSGLTGNQAEVLDFLGGKETLSGMSLKNIGYEGKPILDLTQDEAKELVSDDGFFGITQTSNRVADFVFAFSGDDISKLEKGREGVVRGFDEANKMFGGNLPEISYKTQERTLELIDARIAELRGE